MRQAGGRPYEQEPEASLHKAVTVLPLSILYVKCQPSEGAVGRVVSSEPLHPLDQLET